jgi:hypothetical protein
VNIAYFDIHLFSFCFLPVVDHLQVERKECLIMYVNLLIKGMLICDCCVVLIKCRFTKYFTATCNNFLTIFYHYHCLNSYD